MRTPTPPGFADLLASEWTKIRALRTTWIIVFLALALSVGIAGLSAVVIGMAADDMETSFDPLLHVNLGLILGVIPLKVLGAIVVTSEYGSGMIRATCIVTPRRIKLLIAKALVTGGAGIVLTTLMVIGMYVTSQLVRSSFDLATASISDGETQRFLVTYAAGGVVYILVPFALGFLLRGTAVVVTISVTTWFLPSMIGAAMPLWIQENIFRFLPDTALDSLSGSIATESPVYLSVGLAAFTISAWLIGGLVIAAIVLNRRDV
jgi:ABC-2 type transport system permease protein